MIPAVLDANTIVSATLSQRGGPHQLVLAARARRYQLVTSAVIVTEVLRALARPRTQRRHRLTAADIDTTRRLLLHEAMTTRLTVTVQPALVALSENAASSNPASAYSCAATVLPGDE